MRMMISPDLKQNRLEWLDEDLKVSIVGHSFPLLKLGERGGREVGEGSASDTVYFVGCLPYYDVLFSKIGAQGVEIARSAVRVLNRLGIEPIVLENERCCGHDLLWEGDVANFRKLAGLNAAMLRATGAKRIVTTCPECARTLKVDYPAHVGDLGMEVIHIAELLAQKVSAGEFRIPNPESRITNHESRITTYHDPCRLGRHLGIYDAPRQVIESLGLKLVEMERSGKNALCCGTSCWTNCGAINKQIQVDRLRGAKATGAELLITACAKCQIHFKCAMDDVGAGGEMEIRDLITLVDEALA
jgi:Fe-S oxidoreductase